MGANGGKPVPYVKTPADEREASFSPDGRFVAYVSNEFGDAQVFVQPNPTTGAKWRISSSGGMWPRWRDDGRELYYVQPDGKVVAVEVSTDGPTLRIGKAEALFRASFRIVISSGGEYDVSKDGEAVPRERGPRPGDRVAGEPGAGRTAAWKMTASGALRTGRTPSARARRPGRTSRCRRSRACPGSGARRSR